MKRTIKIPKKESELFKELLQINQAEIYQKHGYKRNECIVYGADFANGVEADIKLVFCDEEPPYAEGVLFQNGTEVCCTEVRDSFLGEWEFDYAGKKFLVVVGEE